MGGDGTLDKCFCKHAQRRDPPFGGTLIVGVDIEDVIQKRKQFLGVFADRSQPHPCVFALRIESGCAGQIITGAIAVTALGGGNTAFEKDLRVGSDGNLVKQLVIDEREGGNGWFEF